MEEKTDPILLPHSCARSWWWQWHYLYPNQYTERHGYPSISFANWIDWELLWTFAGTQTTPKNSSFLGSCKGEDPKRIVHILPMRMMAPYFLICCGYFYYFYHNRHYTVKSILGVTKLLFLFTEQLWTQNSINTAAVRTAFAGGTKPRGQAAENPVLRWPLKPVNSASLPVAGVQLHWKQWHCIDIAGTSQERFRPGKKRCLFHCYHK